MPWVENCVRSTQESLKLLNIYFWIHSHGLPSEFGVRCKYRFAVTMSILLAIFFEGNTMYILYLSYRKCDIYNIKKLTTFIVMCFNTLAFLQRYLLYYRNKDIKTAIARILQVYHKIPKRNSQYLQYKLLSLLIISDAFFIWILAIFCNYYLSSRSFYDVNRKSSLTFYEIWYFVGQNCMYWKNTGQCIAIYFGFVCYALKEAFKDLKEIRTENIRGMNHCIKMYNEMIDVTKKANEAFQAMVLTALVECLIHVFNQTYKTVFGIDPEKGNSTLRILLAMFNYLRLIFICICAASVTNAALDARYSIEEWRGNAEKGNLKQFISKPKKHFPVFTILDSVTIDKSFIFSASGMLLTYGVMIATFNESSKKS